MKRSQWITLGITFLLVGITLTSVGRTWGITCLGAQSSLELSNCFIVKSFRTIPGFILSILGLAFFICGGFEK